MTVFMFRFICKCKFVSVFTDVCVRLCVFMLQKDVIMYQRAAGDDNVSVVDGGTIATRGPMCVYEALL